MTDLAIIGCGPAGYSAAEKAAHAGLKVLLFEKNQIGGVCLNEGCIPTKTLLYSAKIYSLASNGAKYGVDAPNTTFNYEKIVARKTKVVRKLQAGIRAKLTHENITVINEEVLNVSIDNNTIALATNKECYAAKNLLLCTGSTSAIPPIPGLADIEFWTNREALNTKSVPNQLTILGGGVIGIEFASLFSNFGTDVTVVEMAEEILPGIERELATKLREELTKKGVKFLTSSKVTSAQANNLTIQTPENEINHPFEQLLVCTGRIAKLDLAQQLNLKIEHRGVVANQNMQSSIPNVYVAGDITGFSMLAHTAVREAEVAVNTILGINDSMKYNAIPGVVYSLPEIASVGATEEELQNKNIKYTASTLPMTYTGRFVTENEGFDGLSKVLIDSNNKVIGVHLLGNSSSEIISVACLAIMQEMTKDQLNTLVFPHPTISEIIKETLNH